MAARKAPTPPKRTPAPAGRVQTRTSDRTAITSKATLIAIMFPLVVLKNAWVCDDAYIVFRSLEQLFAGNGPVWNPHERVQAFTSPLWYWLLSIPRVVSHDVYLNVILVSLACGVLTLVVVRRALRDDVKFLLGVLLLLCCNGFLDFTTSGLENPLAYLLIAVYLLYYIRMFSDPDDRGNTFSRLALSFGLVVVTRHDLALLLLPSFVQVIAARRAQLDRRGWARLVLLSCGPLVAWSLFALFYYGSIFPNTALAKLNAGIDRIDLMRQGARYLLVSLRYDTIAVIVIATGLVVSFTTRQRWARGLALGVIANVAYVVCVGGDFMQGRFLSCAYFVSVITLLACVDSRRVARSATLAAGALILYAVAYPHTPVKTGRSYANRTQHFGIADERGIFFDDASIYRYVAHARATPGTKAPYFPEQASAKRGYEIGEGPYKLTDSNMIGYFGYWCGTRVMIADRIGLTDPLQARLPAADRKKWRIGHFYRAPVPGYYESIVHGTAELQDPQLNEFYKKVKLITQGPLLSRERMEAIAAMNLGRYEHYLTPRSR